MDEPTRRLVRQRAGDRCEYCGLHQEDSPLARLHVEHVVARKHGGSDEPENLALACMDCNLRKGPNLSGLDPQSGLLTELFNPRLDDWSNHFRWNGVAIDGRTPKGRTTVAVLDLNAAERIEHRLEIGHS